MAASGDSSLKKDSPASAERKQKLRAHVRMILENGLAVRTSRSAGDAASDEH
ncbi:hypothetical protein ACLBXO_09675 [Methylobacterium sp. C33D]|uniref:hypothetical protein n=1 Tax=Methylobacterium mesophilicum TaxID=39956 RepID=UPI002F35778D